MTRRNQATLSLTYQKEVLLVKKKTSVFKYIQLLSARNFTVLCTLGCYLQHAFESREIILRSFSG